jgi:cobalt/nickel transport system permease protein
VTAALPPLDAAPRHPALTARDPRARILVALVAVAAIIAATRLDVLAGLAIAALVAARLAGASMAEIRHRLGHVEGFVVILLVLVPLTTPGPVLLDLGPLTLTTSGLGRAAALALKLNAAALVLLALIGGLAPVSLAQALARLGVPDRLVAVLLFAVRYVGLLREEAERLMTAAKARGFRPTTSRHTLTTIGLLLGTVLIRALERAERVGEAMRCRGFSGRFAVTTARPLDGADIAVILAATLAALALILGDRLL